tara:strand:- start:777 stop:1610 length:834 start_codon:yes stop_codon:yes gene_type:complete
MISCESLIFGAKNNHRFLAKSPDEGPVCFQLSGKEPQKIAEAVKIVTDHGADLIDINCGCPVKKIRKRGAGSKLLSDPIRLYHLMVALKSNTHVPVGIKIRVDGDSLDANNEAVLKAIKDAGIDFLVIHGRHWTNTYDTPCFYDQIQYFTEQLSIPVIGNGDISCDNTLDQMMTTGCAGAMIARAGVGQPWLIGQLIAQSQNKEYTVPENKEIASIFIEHIAELAKLLSSEKFAVIQARKLAKYYGRSLSNRAAFISKTNQCETLKALELICQHFFT